MPIVFFCQSCGARFEVDAHMAGKRGHCKKCGQMMTIPRAVDIASMSAMPALAMAGAGAAPAARATAGASAAVAGRSMSSWLKDGMSKVGLAPLTVDRMPAGFRKQTKPSPLDDAADSKPYVLAQPVREAHGRVTRQDNAALNLWRRKVGGLEKLFRKLNQAAYLISVPFLLILIFGAVVKSRQLALFGAAAVVLLNVGRLAAGAANVALVPLRDGVNVAKMKKPLWRVIEPAVTIVAVIVAFTFIPWLSRGDPSSKDIAGQLRSGAQQLKADIKGEVGRVVDVDKLGEQAQQGLKHVGDKAKEIDLKKLSEQAQDKLKSFRSSSGAAETEGSPPG
jgi:hypothetical protein